MRLLLLPVLLAVVGNAYAKCERVSICDDYGMNCRTQQLCDNSYDVPGVNVVSPYVNRPQVKPIQTPRVPPIGTSRCQQKKGQRYVPNSLSIIRLNNRLKVTANQYC